jgi:hypothetical protein
MKENDTAKIEASDDESFKKLKTALELACEEIPPPDRTPQTSAFLSELRRTDGGTKRNYPHGLLIDGRAPAIADYARLVSCIAEHSEFAIGGPICTRDEFERLAELQGEHDRTQEEMADHSPAKAGDKYMGQHQEMREAAHAGTIESVPPVRSRNEINEDFRARRQALDAKLVTLTHRDVVPLASAILDRFDRTLEAFLRNTEEADQAQAEHYGLEFQTSLLWKAAAVVAQRFGRKYRLPIEGAWKTPRAILEDLITL